MKKRYKHNKDTKVGEECICPSCGTKFIKQSYQQVFCKSKGGTICKDKYWNTVTPTKHNNTTRISPANKRYYENVIQPRQENDALEAMGLDFLLDCGDRD
jgi:beta-N-acetylglucosaminidase